MSLKHALLALISAGPMTGYDITKYFDTSVGFTWHAPSSQIYPQLRRLESEGLIEATVEARGTHGSKRVYSLTEAGDAEFRRWVRTTEPPVRARDVHRLRSAYFDVAEPDEIRAQLRAHGEHYERSLLAWEGVLEGLRRRTGALIVRRLASRPAEEHDEIVAWKIHAYEGLVALARAELEWVRQGLELVDEMEQRRRAKAARTTDG